MLEKQCYIPEPEEFIAETPLPEALKKLKRERDRGGEGGRCGQKRQDVDDRRPLFSARERTRAGVYFPPRQAQRTGEGQAGARAENLHQQAAHEGRRV